MNPITVALPVGPNPAYLEWLPEAIDSVLNQTELPNEIFILDDSNGAWFKGPLDRARRYEVHVFLSLFGISEYVGRNKTSVNSFGKLSWYVKDFPLISYYSSPWTVGVSDIFNFGVALSENNLVFMMGSDDKLMPTCLEECVKSYEKHKIEGWYNVTIETSSGEKSWIPNHAAMITQKFQKWSGGFGPSAFAAPDAWMLSILMKHAPERIIQVKQGTPLYWVREHEHQDTKKTYSPYAASGIIEVIRNQETERWRPKS